MSKIQIKEVESGTIDLYFNGQQQLLQFNCSCDDALPYCKAMCCRNRPAYNVLLNKEEEEQFGKQLPYPHDSDLKILDHTGGHCIYLTEECRCSVQETKPAICKRWHCSPGGVGEGIDLWDSGWALVPGKGDIQHQELQDRIKDEVSQK
jgi:hypothetical protein